MDRPTITSSAIKVGFTAAPNLLTAAESAITTRGAVVSSKVALYGYSEHHYRKHSRKN